MDTIGDQLKYSTIHFACLEYNWRKPLKSYLCVRETCANYLVLNTRTWLDWFYFTLHDAEHVIRLLSGFLALLSYFQNTTIVIVLQWRTCLSDQRYPNGRHDVKIYVSSYYLYWSSFFAKNDPVFFVCVFFFLFCRKLQQFRRAFHFKITGHSAMNLPVGCHSAILFTDWWHIAETIVLVFLIFNFT